MKSDELEWTNDLAIRLIQEYEKRPELWDTRHEMYRVQTLKYNTWSELARMFDCDIADLRKKLNSLFASHRREKAKVRAGGRSTWFLYPYMSFLPSHIGNDSGETVVYISNQPKTRPPVKERAPPSSSDNDDDNDDDNEHDAMENDSNDEDINSVQEVHIKQEPVRVQYKQRTRVPARTHKPRITRPLKRRIVEEPQSSSNFVSNVLDSRLAEAVKLLRRSEMTRKMDECDSFAKYIADSLRKHDDRTQSMIKQAINNILFEQEMKKYSSNQQYAVVLAGIDENPLILSDQDVTDK